MKKLLILGGRGIGMIAASVANDLGTFEIMGFLNDYVPLGEKVGKYSGYKIIGKIIPIRLGVLGITGFSRSLTLFQNTVLAVTRYPYNPEP